MMDKAFNADAAVLGRILSETRISRSLTLDDVERDTRIAKRYLEALEHDEFDVLPAPVYCRAFLRSYAQYLGLDPKEIIRLYPEKGREAAELEPLPQVSKPAPPALSMNWIVAGGAVLVLMLAGFLLYSIGSGGDKPGAQQAVVAEATKVQGEGAEQSTPPTQPTSAASVEAEPVGAPNVMGGSLHDALSSIYSQGLTYVVVMIDDDAPEGQILSQSPAAGEKVSTGTPVTLVVSRGAP